MCFPLFNCFKSWLKPGRLLARYYTLNFYKKSNMNLFKLVDKMHDKLLYSHYLHCTAYQCWRPGVPKAIYSTGNTSRKNLLLTLWVIKIIKKYILFSIILKKQKISYAFHREYCFYGHIFSSDLWSINIKVKDIHFDYLKASAISLITAGGVIKLEEVWQAHSCRLFQVRSLSGV